MTVNFYKPTEELKISDGVYKTSIDGLYYIEYPKFIDNRGLFSEILKPEMVKKFINPDFQIKQVNFSLSETKVVRGMHAEGWNKLITVLNGEACLVLADTRKNSPTFKNVEYFNFKFDPNSKLGQGLYISKKIANSICAVEGPVHYVYGVDLLYHERNPKDDMAISIFDPDLKINWPFNKDEMIISERDIKSITLQEALKN
jgi:dTDP-4-dehydrorhamnose 3,5-epimerase